LREVEMLRPRLQGQYGLEIAVRLGIHTGPVVIGEMGGGAKKETLALGDTPNVAARLQQLAEPGQLLISEATRRLVAGLFVTEDRGTPALKGVDEPIRVHRVLESSGITSRLDRALSLTPFVGREEELGLLWSRFEWAEEGRGQAVLISGEPGIGKSRLVQQLRERLAEAPHEWLECQSSSYKQNSALYPLIELIEQTLDFRDAHSPDERLGLLERGLARTGMDLAETVPLFAGLLSLRLPERYPPLAISPQLQRQKTLAALCAWLLALGEKQPLVLVLEDLHWTDPSTLEWLGLLVEQCPTAGVLLLLTFRPEFEPPWPGQARLLHIALDRLKRDEARRLVAEAASGTALPHEFVDRIAERSDGVPLFAEELAKDVLDTEPGRTGSLAERDIPETVQDLLMARLDRLGAAKQVAQIGAAIGREFPYALLEAVAPLKPPELQEGIGRLVESELVYPRGLPPDASYSFKHALVQEAAYESLLKSQRRELHGRIADALDARFAEFVARRPEEIARHYELAGRTTQAIGHYQRAGERSAKQSAYVEAIGYLHKALELLRTLPDGAERDRRELSLTTRLGGALAITQGFASSEVEHTYVRARHLAEQLGDTTELFRTLNGLMAFHGVRAENDRARELGGELVHRARSTRDREQLLLAHWLMASLGSFWLGEFSQALEHVEAAIGHYDPRDYKAHDYPYSRGDPGLNVFGVASGVLWHLGYPDQALERMREARARARELSDPFSEATLVQYGPRLNRWRGDYRAALEEAEALMALADEHGFLFQSGNANRERTLALTGLGNLDAGIAGLRALEEAARGSGLLCGYSETLAALARALGSVGQVEEGLAVVAEALAFVARTGERYREAEIHRIEGDLLLGGSQPEPAQAEAAFRTALEVVRRQSAKSLELPVATSLARLWQQQGRMEEARALLQPVYDWFTEGFDTPPLKDAKALLEELT
jgi:predicted ATPase